jgi:hypothetical protein
VGKPRRAVPPDRPQAAAPPRVGDLDLTYEAFDLSADPGLRMLVYTAEAGTPTADALNLLASWAATQDRTDETRPARTTADGDQ